MEEVHLPVVPPRYIGWRRGRGRGVPTSDWKTVDGSPKRLTAIRYPLVIPDWCQVRYAR